MVTYGKGGWTWNDVYNLPIFLRMYYMKKLSSAIEKESDAIKSSSSSGQVMKPNIPQR